MLKIFSKVNFNKYIYVSFYNIFCVRKNIIIKIIYNKVKNKWEIVVRV